MTLNTNNNQYKTKSVFANQIECLSDFPSVTVFKPVNELSADAIDYQNYRFIIILARYDGDIASELNRMTKKLPLRWRTERSMEQTLCRLSHFSRTSRWYAMHEIFTKGSRCCHLNTIAMSQSNQSSWPVSRYHQGSPKHSKGITHCITLSSTTCWNNMWRTTKLR